MIDWWRGESMLSRRCMVSVDVASIDSFEYVLATCYPPPHINLWQPEWGREKSASSQIAQTVTHPDTQYQLSITLLNFSDQYGTGAFNVLLGRFVGAAPTASKRRCTIEKKTTTGQHFYYYFACFGLWIWLTLPIYVAIQYNRLALITNLMFHLSRNAASVPAVLDKERSNAHTPIYFRLKCKIEGIGFGYSLN
jgi:hypothetical protein